MKKRVLALLLAVVMLVGVLAACGGTGNSSTGGSGSGTTSTGGTGGGDTSTGGGEAGTSDVSTGPDDTSELYEFTRYFQYDTEVIKTWGDDMVSRALEKKFNVKIYGTKPDSDSDSKFALMLTDQSWPEVVYVARSQYMPRLIKAGGAIPLDPFRYEGNLYDKNMGETTLYVQAVDGKDYGFGTWVRSGKTGLRCTGGNNYWMINPKYYEAVGSPKLETLDDYHDYAVKIKEANLTNYNGAAVQPIYFSYSGNGRQVWNPIARSLGLENVPDDYWVGTWKDGKSTMEFATKNELVQEAIHIANQWFREGLWSPDTFSDDYTKMWERVSNGTYGLVWGDFSQDNSVNFRRLLTESDPESTYEVVGAKGPDGYDLSMYPFFPHEEGVVTYGDINGVAGWSQNVITPKATNPQRIFDVFSFMLDWEYAAWFQYGPPTSEAADEDKADTIWDGYDEDGTPQLKIKLSELTSTQSDALGAWIWNTPINSDPVDNIKFQVDAAQPEGSHDFTSYIQTQTSTTEEAPRAGQKLMSIEWENMGDAFETSSDLGVARQALQDYVAQNVPMALQAATDEECQSIIDDINAYYDANRGEDIREAYQAVVDSNVEAQGFSVLDPAQEVYKVLD